MEAFLKKSADISQHYARGDFFRIFRKINILEYKNPHDSLNERTVYKAAGYAAF